MNVFVAQFGEASGPAALGINGQAFLIQLITFLIVFLILKKWAIKPIIKLLNARRELIESGVELGEKMRAEKAQAEERASQTLHKARAQADQIVADAQAEAKQKVAAAEETAAKRADGIVKQAHEQIKQAADRERKRLEREVVGLVSEVSEAIIHEKVDAKKDAALIDRALKGRS